MLSLSPNKKKTKIWRWVASVVVILVVLGLVLELIAWWIGGTLWRGRAMSESWLGEIGTYFSSKIELEQQNRELENKIAAQQTELMVLRSQMPILSELQKYQTLVSPNNNLQLVRVLSRAPQTPFDELLIYAETELLVGQQVFYDNLLIGEVIDVNGKNGRVALWSKVGNQLSVNIGQNFVHGTAVGKGSGNLVLTLPKGNEIGADDMVYLAGSSQPIGRVSFVEEDENTPSFVQVFINLPFSPYQVNWLSIDTDVTESLWIINLEEEKNDEVENS